MINKEEIKIMDKFIVSCIQSMGVFSEEAKEERKLKKRKEDN